MKTQIKSKEITPQKKENRGGTRVGAGHPFKYGGEETINITLRIPKSQKQNVKDLIYAYLEKFKRITTQNEMKNFTRES